MAATTLAPPSVEQETFLDSNELVLNMGPQHPSTHGVLRVILKLDGESVLGADCVIGYLHRGCLLYTSPSPRDGLLSRMPSSA